ncbi:MAG: DUF2066 domain-containing protein [Sneathiella sp.]|nr:DUF2066 domain-containing protein [Sneathiella sp.]
MTETKLNLSSLVVLSLMVAGFFYITLNNATAVEDGLYVIRGISVDVTANSASEARTIAVAEGQQRAFRAMLRKMTPKSYHAELPEISDSELTSMVTGFQVSKEKTSSTRYLADLTFDFKRNMILPILDARDIPYSETVSKPLLVLPVFDNAGVKNLWNEPNPWRDAWIGIFDRNEGPTGNQKRMDDWAQIKTLPILVPSGTLDDFKAVSVEDAVNLVDQPMKDISDLYGAGAVLVAYATLQSQGGIRRLDISYQRNDFLSAAVVESFTGGDTDPDIYRAAIFDVVENLQEGWKDQNILDRSVINKLAVSSQISGLKEWMQIQEKVKSIPAIQSITVRELSIDKAFWEFSFVGEIEQLAGALAQRDLVLQNSEGYWTMDTRISN